MPDHPKNDVVPPGRQPQADPRPDVVERALQISGGPANGRETTLLRGVHAAVGLVQDMDVARSAALQELARKELMLHAFSTWAGDTYALLGEAARMLEGFGEHPGAALMAQRLRAAAASVEVAETGKEGGN